MEKLSVTLIATLLLGITQSAVAANVPPASGLAVRVAKVMDANRDGVITRDEFLSVSRDEALWTRLDIDGDGVIDADELRRGARFKRHTRH